MRGPERPEDDPQIAELIRRLGAGETFKQLRQFQSAPIRELAAWAGVDVAELESMATEQLASIVNLKRAIKGLGPLGWAVTQSQLTTTAIAEAVRLLETGAGAEEIDEHMTAAWNEGSWLARCFQPMFGLVGDGDRSFEIMSARRTLLVQAVRHHEAGEYAASILIVLTQTDGLASDVRGRRAAVFTAKADDFVDDVTVAGLPENLRLAWRAIVRDRRATSIEGELRRNAILHGRELGYATKVNSTKAFAFLRAVIEWLKPQAAAAARE